MRRLLHFRQRKPVALVSLLILGVMFSGTTLFFTNKPSSQSGPTYPVQSPVTTTNENTDLVYDASGNSADIATSDTVATENATASSDQQLLIARVSDKRVGDEIQTDYGEVYPIRRYSPQLVPNDPYANQWWHSTLQLPAVWGETYGSEPTLLAIIDTGFALGHEEFTDRWALNLGESGPASTENISLRNCTDRGLSLQASCNLIDDNFDGILDNESGTATRQNPSLLNCTDQGRALDKSCNRIDDDGNGFVDDYLGWDFVSNYPSSQAGRTNPNGSETDHGTMVAGVAAANGNNGVGLAGVNWGTKLLPLQAISDDGYGDTLTVGRAIRYAADRGADVINLSLGTASPDTYIRNAVAYAMGKGSIVVASSGNNGCNCVLYPARYEEVVAVGATNSLDERASFSSFGTALDLVAPGTSMISATWTAANGVSAYASGINGTSFSAPIVSATLALLRSHQPTATTQQLVAAMNENVNRLTLAATAVRADSIGYGRLNVQSALSRVRAIFNPEVDYSFYPVTLGTSEPAAPFLVRQCDVGKVGTTPVYKLSKSGSVYYTISEIEKYRAQATGHTATLVGPSFCMNLPTDTPASIRALSIPAELENQPFLKF